MRRLRRHKAAEKGEFFNYYGNDNPYYEKKINFRRQQKIVRNLD
jgi:hypothetical protein